MNLFDYLNERAKRDESIYGSTERLSLRCLSRDRLGHISIGIFCGQIAPAPTDLIES